VSIKGLQDQVLCETRNQFVKAKKRLKKMLVTLKLKLSPHKTKMGAFKTFHFLGVNFASARTEHRTNPLTTAISIHPRSCRRALDKLTAMREDAVHPAEAQRYLLLGEVVESRNEVCPSC